jgi:DNA primase catalytic subunit
MVHTFFENNSNYQVEEQFDRDQFIVEIAFAPDDTQLDLLFDTDADYYPELVENLESGFWQHMICRVQALYDGKVMGEAYLGSVVSESPAKWLANDGQDQVEDLVDSAISEAQQEAVRMIEILKQDFLGMKVFKDISQKEVDNELN